MKLLPDQTYVGPPIDDPTLLARLPKALAMSLEETNGFVAFGGGLHVRGICAAPAWHSLARFWSGDDALLRIYTSVQPDDVPFGEDALGDQFFLRGADCWRLLAEVDDVEALGCGFDEFISRALADPVEFLGLEPLIRFWREGGTLKPGELINAYPPFSTVEAANGVRLAAVPAHEQHYFLAQLVRNFAENPMHRNSELVSSNSAARLQSGGG